MGIASLHLRGSIGRAFGQTQARASLRRSDAPTIPKTCAQICPALLACWMIAALPLRFHRAFRTPPLITPELAYVLKVMDFYALVHSACAAICIEFKKERLIQLLVSIILIEFCLALVSLFIVVPCTINT